MANDYYSAVACDSQQFLIEVTGIKHQSQQRFTFYRSGVNQSSPASKTTNTVGRTPFPPHSFIEDKGLNTEVQLDKQLLASTVYKWSRVNDSSPRHVGLVVETQSGGEMTLPLFDDVTLTPRQLKEQDYLLRACLPLSPVPQSWGERNTQDKLCVAPIRCGYLYLFYRGVTWREIEISTDETGQYRFNDVDLASFRHTETGEFRENSRQAVGCDLESIWFPAKDNGHHVSVLAAYSEVQLSAARLNYLENNPQVQQQRAQPIHLILRDTHAGQALLQQSMRYRDLFRESLHSDPQAYNRDLEGNYTKQRYQRVQQMMTEYLDSRECPLSPNHPLRYDYVLKNSALTHHYVSANPTPPDTDQPSMSSSSFMQEDDLDEEPSLDYLALVKEKKLDMVLIDDPLYFARYYYIQSASTQTYLKHLIADAQTQPYFKSAELVHHFILQPKINQQDNSLYKYRSIFASDEQSVFQYTLRKVARQQCWIDIADLQYQLFTAIASPAFAYALQDIISLDNYNGYGGYLLISQYFSSLAFNVALYDNLVNEHVHYNRQVDKHQLLALLNDDVHPLSSVILPQYGESLVKDHYPDVSAENRGDGQTSLALCRKWAEREQLDEGEIAQLEFMSFLYKEETNLSKSDVIAIPKIIAAATNEILSGYFSLYQALWKALSNSDNVVTIRQFATLHTKIGGIANILFDTKLPWVTIETVSGEILQKGFIIGLKVDGNMVSPLLSDQQLQHLLHKGQQERPRDHYNRKKHFGNIAFAAESNKPAERLLSTNKQRLPQSGRVLSKETQVMVLNPHSPLGKLFKANPFLIASAKKIDHQARFTLYDRLKIPYFVLLVELINLEHAWHLFNKEGGGRHTTGLASAAVDATTAVVSCLQLYFHHHKPTLNISSPLASRAKAFLMRVRLIKMLSNVTQNIWPYLIRYSPSMLTVVGNLITIVLNIWDGVVLWRKNNPMAAVGWFSVASGALLLAISVFVKVGVIYGLSVFAAAGIVLLILGIVIYALFLDTPIEKWLKNGPFAYSPAKIGTLAYLNQTDKPELAYQQLYSMLLNLRAEIRPVSQVVQNIEQHHALLQRSMTHVISVTANFPLDLENGVLHILGQELNVLSDDVGMTPISYIALKKLSKIELFDPTYQVHFGCQQTLPSTKALRTAYSPNLMFRQTPEVWRAIRIWLQYQVEGIYYPLPDIEIANATLQSIGTLDIDNMPVSYLIQGNKALEKHYAVNDFLTHREHNHFWSCYSYYESDDDRLR